MWSAFKAIGQDFEDKTYTFPLKFRQNDSHHRVDDVRVYQHKTQITNLRK